jgi:acetyl-CoA acetyltransferase family protein
MTDAYILEAVRTPIGKRGGALSSIRPDELAGATLRGLVDRASIEDSEVEDVIMGCVTQIDEQGYNIGRMASLAAGFPVSVAGTTVNRMCASSLQSTNFAAQAVMSGAMDLVIGAGVESMSRVAMGSDGGSLSDEIGKRFDIIPQGLSAELLCDRWKVSRESLDQLAYNSHQRALKATSEGYFSREILPIDVTIDGATTSFTTDEGPRANTNLEKLATLKPAFRKDGRITAASSSQISDGASAILVGSGEKADELGLTRRARFRSMAVSGVDPTMMLSGVIPATEKALKKAGMTMADVDLFEVNEAFGSVVLAWAKDTGADLDKTNVNGGAMALGHPLGCSGARLMTTLLHELERQDKSVGLATLCIGFGMAVATVIERT